VTEPAVEELLLGALAEHLGCVLPTIAPSDRLREDLGLHPYDVGLIVRRLERRVGRGFPYALLEVVETVDELSRLVALWVSRCAEASVLKLPAGERLRRR
jgi:hypothetical protein